MKTYDWCSFYNLFAHKLLEYKDKRPQLIKIIKSVYSETGIILPTLEKDNNIVDIDPFTVFGLFNKGITEANRKTVIAALANKVGITDNIPTDFSGIPVLNNLNATFYGFINDRNASDIDDLWQLFEEALKYADSNDHVPSHALCKCIDNTVAMKGNGKSKITMGLFWIASHKFLNLDSRNSWYIYESGKLPQDFVNTLPQVDKNISAEVYFDVSRKITEFLQNNSTEMKTFVDLSAEAWRYSQKVNESHKKKQNEPVSTLDSTDSQSWFPADFSPGLTVDDWVELLHDPSVFHPSSLEIMKRMLDFGGIATCKQLAEKYGEAVSFYNSGSSHLAKRIFQKTSCNILTNNNKNSKWWPILYTGRYAENENISGIYLWKLRPELKDALEQIDLSDVKLYVSASSTPDPKDGESINYWWLNANPKMWSMSATPVGQIQDYTLYNDQHHKRRVFQNFQNAKVGDMIIGYESTPVKQIVALFQISQEQDGERIYFQKIEHLSSPIDLAVLQTQDELANMEFFKNSQASLLKLTPDEYDCIIDLIRESNPVPRKQTREKYDRENFLDEVFMTPAKYDSLVRLLQAKKNIILQGAPGVGKTFAAERLAYSIMGEKDESRKEFVQFHQNYSYEDFVMGYKPEDDGFKLKAGVFHKFCQRAASDPEKPYFFIIDEINRGNMSKIFGELLMLIEKDYRKKSIKLAYSDVPFNVPENLYIIGMMNTADRSLAMIDYALRRRFSFCDMGPGFDSGGFVAYQKEKHNEKLDKLVAEIKALNQAITEDKSLGKGFCIGHSYLCRKENCTDEWLEGVVEYDILPMLAEYWFDEQEKYEEWAKRLTDAIK